jgi:hypothetical protein
MIFTKKDLQFLNLYASCIDSRNLQGKVFQIKKVDNTTLRFSQITDDVLLFTELDQNNIPDNYCFNFSTSQFVQLLNCCNEKDSIVIEENNIKFGKTSSYKFEQVTMDISSQDKVLEDIKTITKQIINIVDLDKINNIKYFIGTDNGLNFVPIMNNYFVATNRYDYGFIKTENNFKDTIYLSKIMIDIFKSLSLKKVTLCGDPEKYFILNEKTFIVLPRTECIIPNFFEEKWKAYYEFQDKIVVKKDILEESLNRINIFAKENVNTRIFLTFNTDNIKIESKDKGYAEEIIPALIDKNLVGHYIIVSADCLLSTINLIAEEEIIIQAKPDKDSICISIWQKDKERFFINNILPYVD